MVMGMHFCIMPRVVMVMGAVLPSMFVIMDMNVRIMAVFMLVFMQMIMGVSMRVLMDVFFAVRMAVFMGMGVCMLVTM